jgi:hypothetical protein
MTISSETPRDLHFEDLVPGATFALGPLPISVGGDASSPSVSHSVGTLLQLLTESELFSPDSLAVSSFEWHQLAALTSGPEYRVSLEVTNRTLEAGGASGSVGLDVVVSDTNGQAAHQARFDVVVSTLDAVAAAKNEMAHPSFASTAWVGQLVDRLQADGVFSDAASAFDGSVAVYFGESAMGLRLYRGKLIDSGRAVVGDATFSVRSSCATWLRFARRPRNEFISFAMADHFTVSGSTYEYLRMTRALMALTDQVRSLLQEGFTRA